MKLIKTIKLQRQLRIRQEYLCFKVCQHSQNLKRNMSPHLVEFCSINKAVKNINNKLPRIYFILSDLFGGAALLKKQTKDYIKEQEKNNLIKCPICKSANINTIEAYKKTNGPRIQHKLMTYGYKFNKNFCNDCQYAWESEKIN